jgi:hypothetical protein
VEVQRRSCTGKANPAKAETAEQYLAKVKRRLCLFDGVPLHWRLDMRDHDDGWDVVGFDHKMWLSLQCPKCNYDWTIGKLFDP